jgi:hypothetical protein
MIASLLDVVFGCSHSHYSFPITVRPIHRRGVARLTGTYVVCLDCGREFAYDWEEMKVISSHEEKHRRRLQSLATKEAA